MFFPRFIKSCSGELRPLHNLVIHLTSEPGKTPRILSVFTPCSYKGDYTQTKSNLSD